MARIKLAYIGGGSIRGPGTMASLIEQGENFEGSEVVLIDLHEERLALVAKLVNKLAKTRGVDISVSYTTNRREGLADCDAVLTSFRPGGFEARSVDESIPLKYGVIGQETQGPGGFFMALRSINVMKGIVRDMEEVCSKARIFNYTNPVNIVSQAVTKHTQIPAVSFCEGPIVYPRMVAQTADLDPDYLETVMIGLNHASWSTRHLYKGEDAIPFLQSAYEHKKDDAESSAHDLRLLELASKMGTILVEYFQYYYFEDEILEELKQKSTTRAQDIMSAAPDYWDHYREQAESNEPKLNPERSRGGIHELELAIDVMDAIFNDRGEVWYVNVPNRGAIPDFPDDLVVEVPGYADKNGVVPLAEGPLPPQVAGLVKMLGEYQALTAEAAWTSTRKDAIRALASNPLCSSLRKAEALYDEMSSALADHLPERLLAG